MNLASLKNIFQTLLAKREAKPSNNENIIDQMICTGGVCASSWKPFHMKADCPQNAEQTNQINRMNQPSN